MELGPPGKRGPREVRAVVPPHGVVDALRHAPEVAGEITCALSGLVQLGRAVVALLRLETKDNAVLDTLP